MAGKIRTFSHVTAGGIVAFMVDVRGPGAPAENGGAAESLAARPIRGQAVLTKEDFTSAWIGIPQFRYTIVWVGVMGAAVLAMFLITSRDASNPIAFIASPLIVGALAVGLLRGRSRWAENALKSADGKAVDYVFDDYGFQTTSPGRDARLEWRTLHRGLEIKDAFVIYTNPQIVTVVPKRAFSSADQDRLRRELATRIPRPSSQGGALKKALLLWLALIVAFLAIWQFLNTH